MTNGASGPAAEVGDDRLGDRVMTAPVRLGGVRDPTDRLATSPG